MLREISGRFDANLFGSVASFVQPVPELERALILRRSIQVAGSSDNEKRKLLRIYIHTHARIHTRAHIQFDFFRWKRLRKRNRGNPCKDIAFRVSQGVNISIISFPFFFVSFLFFLFRYGEIRPFSFTLSIPSIALSAFTIALFHQRFRTRSNTPDFVRELVQNRFPRHFEATTRRISFSASATFVFTTPPIALTRNERGMHVERAFGKEAVFLSFTNHRVYIGILTNLFSSSLWPDPFKRVK